MPLIVSRERICEAYGMGKDLFYQLIVENAPITKIGKQYVTHSEEMDEWLRRRVKAQAEALFSSTEK